MVNKVLIIDDEKFVRTIIRDNITPFGYEIMEADTAFRGLELAREWLPDLILLDIVLPDNKGWNICRELKKLVAFKNTIIVIMSSMQDTSNIVASLEYYGADDFVVKPFTPRILAAKVNAFFRLRKKLTKKEVLNTISAGRITLNPESFSVFAEEEEFFLTKAEFDILYLLASHPGRTLSRKEIIFHIHGTNHTMVDRVIDVQISSLRKKLSKIGGCVRTIRGIGFKLKSE